MKGLELPINIIIVIAIAVLVLVIITAFFATQTGTGFNTIQMEAAFSSACSAWKSAYNCAPGSVSSVSANFKFPANINPSNENANLQQMCTYKITGSLTGTFDVAACQSACGCGI